MRLPIQYALYYPERRPMPGERLDFYSLGQITFERPDVETFPALRYAYDSIRRGGNIPTAFNAADEFAVAEFLKGKISYPEISEMILHSMETCRFLESPTLDEIFDTEQEVQEILSRW